MQEGDGQRLFDIEIQSVITREEALRTRYYQGILDLDNLLKGSDYVELPQTYIIFLCMQDPFHLNLPIYEPHSYIDPSKLHPYDDKTTKIFYNVSRYQAVDGPRTKGFLQYLKNKTPTNDFTRGLNQMVEELKTIEVGFSDYIAARQKEFDWLRQGKEQGFEAGLQQGIERGAYQTKPETARSMLEDGFPVSTVSKYTYLPLETVQQLEKEL